MTLTDLLTPEAFFNKLIGPAELLKVVEEVFSGKDNPEFLVKNIKQKFEINSRFNQRLCY